MSSHLITARRTGFTLIELLVAISILAIIAVLGWRGLDGIVRARIALNSDLAQTRGMQLAFAQLQSDAEQVPRLTGRATLAADQDRLTLIRTVYGENQPSRLQVVAYRVKDGGLVRRESVATRDFTELDALWQNAVSDADTTPGVMLQADVTTMTIRLWTTPGPWSQPLPPANPPTAVSLAPTGLEVSLKLKNRDAGILKVFLLGAV